MLKRLFLLISLCFFLFSPAKARAQSEFSASYTVNYRVELTGITHASFDIELKNNLSNVYAQEFSLSIGSTNLSNVRALNSSGELALKLNQGEKTTNLNIPFKEKVLGKNQAQVFTLEFDTTDFAHQSGQVWDVVIPKLADAGSLEHYQLSLSIPAALGEPTIISPRPVSQTTAGGYTTFHFTPADLVGKGLSATFGSRQWFDFNLTYHLENPNVYPVRTEIALPPDTELQQVVYQTLQPRPENISVDGDGNWLATYLLSARQSLMVSATGSAEISLNPRADFPLTASFNSGDYLKPAHFWESDNPKIKEIAAKTKTPQAIYQYVVDNLLYDYGRLNGESGARFGAANALDTPDSAVCLEFTDLFIALARAAGIPARAVNGYAYTTNSALRPLSLEKDVLHAWPEYYDIQSNRWIPVDPTWGNTTGGVDYFSQFDLNHFTFVRQGLDSSYPLPAGAYKLSGSDSKDVTVEFGQSVFPERGVEISFDLPTSAIAGVPIKGGVVIRNTGTIALYDLPLVVDSDHFSLKNAAFTIPSLPPFASVTIPIELPATGWTNNLTDTVIASSGDTKASHSITLNPAYNLLVTPRNLLLVAAVLGLLTVVVLALKYIIKR